MHWTRSGGIAALCGVMLFGQAGAVDAATKTARKAEAVTELRLAHAFDPERAAALQMLADGFNAANPAYRLTVLASLPPGGADGAHMAILQGEEMEAMRAGGKGYRLLSTVMREAGVALKTPRPPAMMARTLLDAKGQLLALPVALSTPVLYINRNEFRRVGLDPDAPPKTWFELQQSLGQLFDAGSQCPYTVSQPGRVMIENTSAWHNEPVAARQGRSERAAFNGMLQVKHIAMMASWHRARYLRTFDVDSEAERHFADGECAVIAAPSSSWTDFRGRAKFEVGVAPLPYHDDFAGAPQNTLAEGGALWVSAGKSKAEYKGVARFVAFWLQPENQMAWQRQSGFLPLDRGGMFPAKNEATAPEFQNVRVALAQLGNKPATAESSASSIVGRARVQSILDEELRAVWADRKPAKEALDTAVMRVQALMPALR